MEKVRKFLRLALAIGILAMLLLPLAVSADTPPTLYETFTTGDDTDSNIIAGYNWTAEQFTVGSATHTITSVQLSLKRVGVPGYMYVSIRQADSGLPVGYDLTVSDSVGSLTLLTGSYGQAEFTFSDPITLDAGEEYAICLYAPDGDVSNYVLWQGNSAGGLANAVGSHSGTNGATWASDTPTDYLFSVYGDPVMEIDRVAVFASYIEEDDWLIPILYYNEFEPNASTDYAADDFVFQLLTSNSTVIAASNMRAWGYRPGSIYLSEAIASSLEWGGNYTIRMYGLFGSNPYVDYTLQASDWKGEQLVLLDAWVLAAAAYIADQYGIDADVLVTNQPDGSAALTSTAHVMFVVGIPYLPSVRPGLFATLNSPPSVTDDAGTPTTQNATEQLGPEIAGHLTSAAGFFGVDDIGTMGSILALIAGIGIIAGLAAIGHFYVGVAITFVGLVGTTYAGITGGAIIGIVAFAAFLVWVFSHFANK